MGKKDTPQQLATPNDLNLKGREEIANAVNPLVATAFALYVKLKNFHWHMSGSHFRDYHLLLDEQAEQVFATIDVLAERIRKLGQTTIRSTSQIQKLQLIKDDNEDFLEPQQMLNHLLEDHLTFTKALREAHEICEKNKDSATTSLLENFIDESERRTWFIFETLQ